LNTEFQFQGISHFDLIILLVPIMLIIILQVATLVSTMATEAVIVPTITATDSSISTTHKMDKENMMNMLAL
jgi:hypothetical protein